jgi:hypothetical protein
MYYLYVNGFCLSDFTDEVEEEIRLVKGNLYVIKSSESLAFVSRIVLNLYKVSLISV